MEDSRQFEGTGLDVSMNIVAVLANGGFFWLIFDVTSLKR